MIDRIRDALYILIVAMTLAILAIPAVELAIWQI